MVVANRYARALAEVVAASGDYRRVLQELQDFASAYRESPELQEVFVSPAVALPQKMNVLVAIGQKLGESPVTLNFLRVLLANSDAFARRSGPSLSEDSKRPIGSSAS